MANWASTSYRIEGSRSDLERLFDVIDGFMRGKEDVTEEDIDKFNEEHFEGEDYYIRLCEYSVVDC